MAKGQLVPDSVTIGLVKERLQEPDVKQSGFMLDGFPRTIPQAEALAQIVKIDIALNFTCPDKILIERLTGRRVCRNCGAIYHIINIPPKVPGRCDKCGGELYTRDDDKIEAVTKRLDVYKQQTEPLIEYYRKAGLLVDIDSSHTPEDAIERTEKVLNKFNKF
jgi:adenylate kinase